MQTAQGTTLQSLRAVDGFLTQHADRLPGVADTGARKRLDDAITALERFASEQTGSALTAQGLTQKQRALRTALLRDHMAGIARIAKADLPSTPEFQPLRMPRGRPTPEKLAAAANGMASVASQFPDVFTDAGMPADFVAQLTAAAEAMVGALSHRIQTRGQRRGATAGLKAKLSDGRKVVHILDAFVRTALKDDPVLLSNWKIVMRVPKASGRPATSGTSTGSASAAAPASTGEPAPAV